MTETPVLRQYREAKDQHPDSILLFRLGDFYEIFFEDAEQAAPIMGVTLTSRPLGKSGRMPMCGVPQHAWQGYVGKLLRAGRRVVICDQVEAAGTSKGIVRREVTRVLTPGTVVEEAYLDPGRSNYLVATWTKAAQAGLAACDISTGELILCQLPADRLAAELERLAPAEVLRPPEYEEYRFDPERGRRRLLDVLGVVQLASIGAEEAPLAVGAAGVVIEYLQRSQARLEPGLLRIRTHSVEAAMQLDAATIRNLELPALLKLIDRTRTPMGARRLRAWLWAPLRDVESIELRLGAVEELISTPVLTEALRSGLQPLGDLERLTARAAQGLATPRELGVLRRSLEALPALGARLAGASLVLREIGARLTGSPALATELGAALADEPPTGPRAAGAIRAGYDAQLDGIREASRAAREWIAGLEGAERERTGIRSLKVGYNRVFGYYLEVGHAAAAMVPADYIRKQTLTGAERYIIPDLKEREAIVLSAEQDTLAREAEILRELCRQVAEAAPELLDNAAAAADVDALQSLAAAGSELRWVRPSVLQGRRLSIRGGRHPVVEAALPVGTFVANDVELDSEAEQIVILTGPNMAGKSTYLRQVALIVLLGQCGSYVPAERATIGLADRIFTRVGAHDDLAAGMSTFMVEMTETSAILAHATPDSVLILDEVGRGTSTYDGLSIAQAVVEYLHDSPRLGCRTLFATHYHELTALADSLPRVCNQRVEVVETDGKVRFLHQVVPGGADRSYGIHVAALAGLPASVIARAQQVLAELERHRPLEPPAQQLGLPLDIPADPLRQELERLELDRLSPIEALQKLYELRTQAQTR